MSVFLKRASPHLRRPGAGPTRPPSGSARAATLTSLAGTEWGCLDQLVVFPGAANAPHKSNCSGLSTVSLGCARDRSGFGRPVGLAGIVGTAGLRGMGRLKVPPRAGRKRNSAFSCSSEPINTNRPIR